MKWCDLKQNDRLISFQGYVVYFRLAWQLKATLRENNQGRITDYIF